MWINAEKCWNKYSSSLFINVSEVSSVRVFSKWSLSLSLCLSLSFDWSNVSKVTRVWGRSHVWESESVTDLLTYQPTYEITVTGDGAKTNIWIPLTSHPYHFSFAQLYDVYFSNVHLSMFNLNLFHIVFCQKHILNGAFSQCLNVSPNTTHQRSSMTRKVHHQLRHRGRHRLLRFQRPDDFWCRCGHSLCHTQRYNLESYNAVLAYVMDMFCGLL